MTRHFTVAVVTDGGGGGSPCISPPCIVLQGPTTPPPKGYVLIAVLEQMLSAIADVELDIESLIRASEWLETEARVDDAFILSEFALRRLGPTAPVDFAQRALNVQLRCHTTLGNQSEIETIRTRIAELTLPPAESFP